jgi:hypothetical protein
MCFVPRRPVELARYGSFYEDFLNKLSNAARASFGERGGCTAGATLLFTGAASRATVTRGLNNSH